MRQRIPFRIINLSFGKNWHLPRIWKCTELTYCATLAVSTFHHRPCWVLIIAYIYGSTYYWLYVWERLSKYRPTVSLPQCDLVVMGWNLEKIASSLAGCIHAILPLTRQLRESRALGSPIITEIA